MKITTSILLFALAAGLLVAGCAQQQPVQGEQFGDSVRHIAERQTYNLDAAYNPDPSPVLGGDGDRLNAILESHRKAVTDHSTAGKAPLTGVSGGTR